MANLAGKKVLLIAPQFFGYEVEIVAELKRSGAEVDFIQDRPFTSAFLKAVMRYWKPLVSHYAEKFFKEKILKLKNRNYDYFFVVKGEGLTLNTLLLVKSIFPKITSICYLWDSQRNKGNILSLLPHFDRVYTFDSVDAAAYNFEYRPLFYSSKFLVDPGQCIDYAVSFVGTSHSDRYKVIKNIKKSIPSKRIFYTYLFLQSKWLFYLYKIFKIEYRNSNIDEFKYAALSLNEVASIFWRSFAVLDIEHPNQSGLTMRTFEAMAAGKKLITTNSQIKYADFFSPVNIFIINRDVDNHIPDDFFEIPFQQPSSAIIEKYSINGWVADIFNDQ